MILKMDGPGAPGSAPEANEIARKSSPASEYRAGFDFPQLVWDRAAGSIERLALVRQRQL